MPVETRDLVNVPIPISTSTSVVTYLGQGMAPSVVFLPAAFTANTVYILIQGLFEGDGSADGTCLSPKTEANAVIAEAWITVAATNTNLCVPLTPANWHWCDTVKVTAYQTNKSTVQAQAAARAIVFGVRPY